MLECVVNISAGRQADVLETLARAVGPPLLDVHVDPDHDRSVFTIADVIAAVTEAAARRLATAAAAHLSLHDSHGVHPRIGVIDVVPFVALAPTASEVAVTAARNFAEWIATELGIPAFLYDLADPDGRTLPSVRRDAFAVRRPDAGPDDADPRLGATAVGARGVLVAVNLELDRDDVGIARAVARHLRERDGGLPGVRALGLDLRSRGHAQVSMNLVDPDATGLETACVAARDQIEARGAHVARVELVGLVPASVLAACSPAFVAWSGISSSETIEARAAHGDVAAAPTDAAPDAGPVPQA